MQYPEIREKIHAKLSDYGFMLRLLKDKEYISGFGFEPWHIRYVGSVDIAREIMSQPGMTLEVRLGAVKDSNPTIDCGVSELYIPEELAEAAVQVRCQFASFEGCQLHTLRYAGDAYNTPEELASLNQGNQGEPYTRAAKFPQRF